LAPKPNVLKLGLKYQTEKLQDLIRKFLILKIQRATAPVPDVLKLRLKYQPEELQDLIPNPENPESGSFHTFSSSFAFFHRSTLRLYKIRFQVVNHLFFSSSLSRNHDWRRI
jgi:hypothetical protein